MEILDILYQPNCYYQNQNNPAHSASRVLDEATYHEYKCV